MINRLEFVDLINGIASDWSVYDESSVGLVEPAFQRTDEWASKTAESEPFTIGRSHRPTA